MCIQNKLLDLELCQSPRIIFPYYLRSLARDYVAVCQSISARGAKWKIAHLHPKSKSTNIGVNYFFRCTLRKIHTRSFGAKSYTTTYNEKIVLKGRNKLQKSWQLGQSYNEGHHHYPNEFVWFLSSGKPYTYVLEFCHEVNTLLICWGWNKQDFQDSIPCQWVPHLLTTHLDSTQ